MQSYLITSPSTLDWRGMQAPPAGLMSSLSGLITPRQIGCGWTCETGGRALRPALWRASSPTVQMWVRSKRLRWVTGEFVSLKIVHWHSFTHTETHRKKYTHVPGSDCFSPSCSSAMMGPLQRAAGWLMNYVLLCQPKGSNIYLLASAGWPKIEEMGWLLEYLMCWTQKPFLSPIRSVNVDVLLKAKPCCIHHGVTELN